MAVSSYLGDGAIGTADDDTLSTSLLKKEEHVKVKDEDPFAEEDIPAWQDQITLRGMIVSVVLGAMFSIISLKLCLTVGVIPSLNVAAGLLGFFFIKSWTVAISRLGFWTRPFTRQENTVIQTAAVACYGIAFSGGFGTYLLGLDKKTYETIGADYPGNRIEDVKNLSLGWIIGFLFLVSFIGITVLVPLRKVMILKYKLIYPSGTATAVLINSFHTPNGADVAKKQVESLTKYFTISFFWSMFKWFFSGVGGECGFENFPTFGFKAFQNRFYFDFSFAYIGTGMICPHIVNCSVLLGAIISWGVLWPLIGKQEGKWYPAGLGSSDFKGLYGYKVFVAISLILGDGFYNVLKILGISLYTSYKQYRASDTLAAVTEAEELAAREEDSARNRIFVTEGIPFWLAASLYVILAAFSITLLPQMFPAVKWYYVFITYIVAPVLAFCNSYGAGLTDWSLASSYGKLAIFIFAAWAGSNGGVVAGLVACGVMMSIVCTASDLMQDFRTGYLTLSSPRSMFVSQLIGTALGCVVAPLCFWMFWTAFDIEDQEGEYKAPYAVIYRAMGIIGVEGFSALPNYCLELCYAVFVLAIILNLLRDLIPPKYAQFIPISMAMAIPFYVGAYFAIDMFVGTLIVFIWEYVDKEEKEVHSAAVASGLICGDGVWTVPSAILALCKIEPPICMTFFPSGDPANLVNGTSRVWNMVKFLKT